MKTISLMARDEDGRPILINLTREEIDYARREMLADTGKKFVSGSCLSCGQAPPNVGKVYCEGCD